MNKEEKEVNLFCDSVLCLKADGRDAHYPTRMLKATILEKAYKPGRHYCPDCRGLLVPKRKNYCASGSRVRMSTEGYF
jgi:hypothetical protein